MREFWSSDRSCATLFNVQAAQTPATYTPLAALYTAAVRYFGATKHLKNDMRDALLRGVRERRCVAQHV
jgi:hypothetical protein